MGKSATGANKKVFTVSEFVDRLNRVLTPQKAIIKGETGKINRYPGFSFLKLLDKKEKAILNCFVPQRVLKNVGVTLKEGIEIKVFGYPKVHKPKGQLNFQVEKIALVGEGQLKRAFEALKKKLKKAGFFEPERKKAIPKFCQKIGLITSKYSKGALLDFKKHLGEYGFEVYLYDTRVEGSFATDNITKAVWWFNKNMVDLDIIVMIRGGGSWESLQSFNSERVAKSIFASKLPVICGVGHEKDETIAGYVADLRTSTPTDAAKVITEEWKTASKNIPRFQNNLKSLTKQLFSSVKEKIIFFDKNLTTRIKNKILTTKREINEFKENLLVRFRKEITSYKENLDGLTKNLNLGFQNQLNKFQNLEKNFKKNFLQIRRLIKKRKVEIDQKTHQLIRSKNNWEKKIKNRLTQQREKLILSSPQLKLKQGYTVTSSETGEIIKNPFSLKPSQIIETKFYKGQVLSKVKKIYKNKKDNNKK